jgi:hypothetical protein
MKGRSMVSRLCRAVLLCAVGAACLGGAGCVYSQKVWVNGYATESLKYVHSVRVAESGSICVVYAPNLQREVFARTGPLQGRVKVERFARFGAKRAVVLTRSDVYRLMGGNDAGVIRAPALEPFIRPRAHTAHAHDVEVVEAMTSGWREVPVVVVAQRIFSARDARKKLKLGSTKKEKARFKERMKQMAKDFADKEKKRQERARQEARARGDAVLWAGYLEVPNPQGGYAMLQIPVRQGYKPWTWPVRVLLVAPAAVADVAEGVVVGVLVVCSLPFLPFQ